MKPPKVAGKRYLSEHDRDLYEAELMYDQWLEGQSVPGPHYPYADVPDDLPVARLEGFDENDPFDRLKSEGGHIGE